MALGGFATAAAIVAARRADVFNTIGLNVDERMSAGDDARKRTGMMWIGLGGCVALMATGATLWLLDPGPSGSAVSAGAALLPGGAAVALEGRW